MKNRGSTVLVAALTLESVTAVVVQGARHRASSRRTDHRRVVDRHGRTQTVEPWGRSGRTASRLADVTDGIEDGTEGAGEWARPTQGGDGEKRCLMS